MFRKYLEKDLMGVFEKDKVSFSASLAHYGSELQRLFIVLDQDGIKNNFREGENYFSVVGTIEFLDDNTLTSFGFFSQRMALSKFETAGNLKLLGRESNESLSLEGERLLIKKSQKFSYRIAIPYNKPIGEIEELQLGQITII
jgi:hypothetical protein